MKSKYFKIQELVPKEIYELRGEKAWELIDNRLIVMIDLLKEDFPAGTITINNWLWGGSRSESGLRIPTSKYYSQTSQHSLGRAVDCIFSEYSTEEVRRHILDNIEKYDYIRGMEIASWLHIDVRNRESIIIFDENGKRVSIV